MFETLFKHIHEEHAEMHIKNDLKKEILEKGKSMAFKTVASDNFLTSLNEAHNKVEKIEAEIKENFDTVLNEGLKLLKESVEKNDKNIMLKASDKFVHALELKKSFPEPYFFLAHIFSYAGDRQTALKYYQAVKLIKPDYPGLDDLKSEIYANA